jgi:small-conductance mechanosensitive channel
MQDGARFFAYSTWALMISLGVIVFTHQFFRFMDESIWLALIIALAFGFIYFNLVYAAIKRFIRKVPAPTNTHTILSGIIFLPPAVWIFVINDAFTQNELLLLLILVLAAVLGTIFGNKAGIKARYEYVQKLKEYQKQAEEKRQN